MGARAFVLLACGVAGAALAQPEWGQGPPELPPQMAAAAETFDAWTGRAGAMTGGFSGAEQVRAALRATAPPNETAFAAAMLAYGAAAADADPRFDQEARQAAAEAGGDYAAMLAQEPWRVLDLPDAPAAAARVEAAWRARAQGVLGAGASVKQAAYTIQHAAWSRARAFDGPARLAEVKALAADPPPPGADAAQRLDDSLARLPAGQPAAAPPSTDVVDALALGAIAAAEPDAPPPSFAEPANACLRLARLDLYQCLAVAGPEYEDVFCLGEHALGETGACLMKAAGPAAAQPGNADPLGALLAGAVSGTSRDADYSLPPGR